MKYVNLKKHLNGANGSYAPAYLVYGSDDYLKSEAVKALKGIVDNDFVDFNLAVVQDDVDGAIAALNTFALFGDVKAVVLIYENKLVEQDIDKLKEYLAAPSDGSVLIMRTSADNAALLKCKAAEPVICNGLEKEELAGYIRDNLDGAEMGNDAIDELIVRTQGSMARIVSELCKLKAYGNGKITKQNVEEMVVAELDYQLYMLTDAIAKKSPDTLKMLGYLLSNGVRPKMVLDGLYERFRRMLHIALNKSEPNDYFAEKFLIKPGAVYYLRKTLDSYTQVKLKNIVDELHELQYAQLQGKISEESAMHMAILSLMK